MQDQEYSGSAPLNKLHHLLLQQFPAPRQPLLHGSFAQIQFASNMLHRSMFAIIEHQGVSALSANSSTIRQSEGRARHSKPSRMAFSRLKEISCPHGGSLRGRVRCCSSIRKDGLKTLVFEVRERSCRFRLDNRQANRLVTLSRPNEPQKM